jgi:hypothetical protein
MIFNKNRVRIKTVALAIIVIFKIISDIRAFI